MHPAKSVILFTTASGAGYGLIAMFAILDLVHIVPKGPMGTLSFLGTGVALVVLGLLSSTFHLGHPERAWRALSQWRTSWLSREGVMAILTFVPVFAYAGVRYVEPLSPLIPVLAIISAAFAVVTVYCTAMIYACLRTVPAWFTSWTPAVYIALSLASGMVLLNGIALAWSLQVPMLSLVTALLLMLGLAVKLMYWHAIENAEDTSTIESATGLGDSGKVRLLDPPHDGSNYLMQEMGFAIARKHASRLRRLVVLWGFCLPVPAVLLGGFGMGETAIAGGLAGVALVAVGVVTERWLFFAEAKHAVSLYYGADKV